MTDQEINKLLSVAVTDHQILNDWQAIIPQLTKEEKKKLAALLLAKIKEETDMINKYNYELRNLLDNI